MTEVFGTGVYGLMIRLLLGTCPQTVGGRDVKGTSGLILQLLVSSWRIVPRLTGLFKCPFISGTQTSRAAGLVERIRNEGETEAILLPFCDGNCAGTSTCHPTTMTTEVAPKKRGRNRKWSVREQVAKDK